MIEIHETRESITKLLTMDLCELVSLSRKGIDQQGPQVVLLSSSVATDGHEIHNVFHEKGFMAERFVKVRKM